MLCITNKLFQFFILEKGIKSCQMSTCTPLPTVNVNSYERNKIYTISDRPIKVYSIRGGGGIFSSGISRLIDLKKSTETVKGDQYNVHHTKELPWPL